MSRTNHHDAIPPRRYRLLDRPDFRVTLRERIAERELAADLETADGS